MFNWFYMLFRKLLPLKCANQALYFKRNHDVMACTAAAPVNNLFRNDDYF